jgi:hypothetical protein
MAWAAAAQPGQHIGRAAPSMTASQRAAVSTGWPQ